VTQPPPLLDPSQGERGLASADDGHLAWSVARSWELFTALVDEVDLDAVTRAKGLTAREVVIPLGAWDDNRPLADLLADARRGAGGDHDQGALVEAVRAAHRDASDDDVREALRRQGEQLSSFLTGPDPEGLWEAPVASMLGTLPLVTFLHAATYPLATSALDLERAGAVVPDELLDLGLLGLVDTIGALGARQGLTASIAAVTPTGTVGTGIRDGAWRTRVLAQGASGSDPDRYGPSVRGSARILLDVTAGRADVPGAVARKELGVHDVPGLMALAPIVEAVPGIPGRAALVAAIRATQALGAAWRLLPWTRST
jgi:hypothetical protein